ncbi:MAG: M20/M25/M40 family metallo-hydrolase [Leptolyngbya sp. DLM2.Bin15]|nr:MAG: M20/M25/M40 family metallo-hydrolase [Leptolyngbya sp. DLM2.Bin15]
MRQKRWLALLLVLGVILGILGGHRLLEVHLPAQGLAADPMGEERGSELMYVDPERLMADVAALSFPRVEEGDRQQALDYLEQSLTESGWQTERLPFAEGVNLVAHLGSPPPGGDRLLLGAHYDTVAQSPGADDNASGIAVVLEVARLLGTGQMQTQRSLTLAIFDQEETGLVGSRALAADTDQLQGLQGAIILDMVGYACYRPGCQTYPERWPLNPMSDRGDFLAVIGDRPHPDLVEAFAPTDSDRTPPILSLLVPAESTLLPDVARSDHAAFWEQGIGAVLVTDTANFRNPHYHQASDRPETLDRDFLTASAQRVWEALVTLLTATSSADAPSETILSRA